MEPGGGKQRRGPAGSGAGRLHKPISTAASGGSSPRLYTLTVTSTDSEPQRLRTSTVYLPELSVRTSLMVMVLQPGSLVMKNWSSPAISRSLRSQKTSGVGSPSMKHVRHRDCRRETVVEFGKGQNHPSAVGRRVATLPSMMATTSGRPFVTLARSETNSELNNGSFCFCL